MPNSPTGSNFMDDFYAECDEHLVAIRRALLQLEQPGAESGPTSRVVESIFRSLHSVKGICGMAGLQAAERLAHTAEDYLRDLTRGQAEPTAEGLDILTRVTQKLEELALGHRQGCPEEDVSQLVEQTRALLTSATVAPVPKPAEPALPSPPSVEPASAATQKRLLRCVFRPSAELSKRGVNVNSVRAHLQEFGEIVRATPKVQPGGELLFEFVVLTNQEEALTEKLKQDGVDTHLLPDPVPGEQQRNSPSKPVPAGSLENAFVAPSQFVRVEMTRLDDLMGTMGNIVVQQARLEEVLGRIDSILPGSESNALEETRHTLGRELRHLRDGLMGLRLVPIGEVFDRLPFVVRDLSRERGKKARMEVKGQATELDKYLVEKMKDPLLHLVRNAVTHGLEEPEERLANGKSAEGTITLRAFTIGETVLIEVSDDGRGLDQAKIAAMARSNGLFVHEEPSATDLLELICTAGFSTRDSADLGSGRGMGMAAVKSTVLDLGGDLELESEPGRGTTFRLRLPLTLAVADALIITAGGQRFAMPQAVVQEITTTETTAINRLEQNEIMRHRSSVLPLLRLSSIFGLTAAPQKAYPVLVIGTGFNALGIVADRILEQREIVVRPIKDPLLKVPGISGATELGDGRAVLILDSVSLAQTAKGRQRQARQQAGKLFHAL